ncbi:MAG TPA: hypothetical protein VKN99_00250 [Polyangia bacterium]|nr:hypothetical protein [Polyangia bacterium]
MATSRAAEPAAPRVVQSPMLNLTPLVDVFLVLVLFLLSLAQPSGSS